MAVVTRVILPEEDGATVRHILRAGLHFSSHAVSRLAHGGECIFVNGVPVHTPHILRAGDVLAVEPDLSPGALRLLADKLAGSCGGRCACASPKPEGGCSYVLACREGDVRPLAQELNRDLSGRGGGKPNFVQGGVSAGPSEFVTFFAVRGFHGL